MAKSIKAIECPKCGSTSKKELRTDSFKCNSCNTEYYLDNDDITINHNVTYSSPNAAPPFKLNKKTLVGMAVAFFVISMIYVVLPLLFSKPGLNQSFAVQEASEEHWWHNDQDFFFSGNQKPIMVLAGDKDARGKDGVAKNIPSVAFYDLIDQKLLATHELKIPPKQFSDEFRVQRFENGEVYIIANKQSIFRADQKGLRAEDITNSLFSKHPEMASGLANAEFMYTVEGEGFKVVSNEGKNFFYYPAIDQLYTKEEMQEARKSLETAGPGDKLRTKYAFSRESHDYPDEGIQLIQYTIKDHGGGPDDYPVFRWAKDVFSSSGKEKRILSASDKLARSWKDLTPGRKYFSPDVLYADKELVLITFSNTPAENAPKSVQCLDGKTGAIKFTLSVPEGYLSHAVRYRDGFVIEKSLKALVVDNSGKIISEFKIP